jgi:hypothetical protein
MRLSKTLRWTLLVGMAAGLQHMCSQSQPAHRPADRRAALATAYFGNDAPWFLRNIPFLEIDDAEIQRAYYYRWQVYRSHIREIGPQGTTVLEFLNNVPWARQPFTDLNDSAYFHLMEGRWMRDPSVVNDLIDHLYTGGANDRHFSESIAAATEAVTLVTGETEPALRHLDTMQHIYNLWDDHFDRTRNLYWIEPLLDATEYTIASIDASGAGFTDSPSEDQNRNGFIGGFAFRPSINSYQFANAMAISRLAAFAGKRDIAADYAARAGAVQAAVLGQLWNPSLEHFTDRYQRSTETVTAGEFIRGRELVGYLPWLFELPPKDNDSAFGVAWKHAVTKDELGGAYGLRTVEPTYPRYMKQYRYDASTGLPECQWNGPSWPFQSSQVLTAMANVLEDYPAAGVTRNDYLRLLRQYTHQHFLSPGHPDIEENYNPDTGAPIVGLPRSHHYEHSTYVDLILSGLLGIRPRSDDVLEIDPLIPLRRSGEEMPIRYFALRGLKYHGHDVEVYFDADGSRYSLGPGITVFVDGKLATRSAMSDRLQIKLGAIPAKAQEPKRVDLAVSFGGVHDPVGSVSSALDKGMIAEAIDGRMWFFPEIANGWSPIAGDNPESWYAIDLQKAQKIDRVELYFFSDGSRLKAPSHARLQRQTPAGWSDIPGQTSEPETPLANGLTSIRFPAISTQSLRVVLVGPDAPSTLRMVEMKVFAPVSK